METGPATDIPAAESTDADFQADEWLALFPAPSEPVPTFGDAEHGANPDDAARAADPLTAAAILDDVSGLVRAAAWPAFRVHGALPPLFACAAFGVWGAAIVALVGVGASLGAGQFAAKDVALGIAGLAAFHVGNVVSFGLSSVAMGTNVSRLTDFTVPAAVCRWLRLVRRPKTRPISPLVRHVAGDRSCPCQECCSWAEGAAGFYSLLDVATNTVMSWVLGIFFVYTPVVTYAGALWSTWYGILLGIVWATVFPGYLLVSFVRPLVIDNLGRADLERRLLCRAVGIAMGDLLGRFRRAAAAGNPPPRPDRWSYIGLHYRFAALCSSWRRRESIWTSRIYGLVLVPVAVLFVGLCAAVGRCILAWQLVLLAHAAVFFAVNAVNLASRNRTIDAVAAVYRDAQRELRALAVRAGAGALSAELDLHDRALGSFLDVTNQRAGLFGFVVTFGSVRTMVVTGITVAVALFTVLRALGVTATLENFCPATA